MDASHSHHAGDTDGVIAVPSVSNSGAATPSRITPDSEMDISCSYSASDLRKDTEQVCTDKSICAMDKASEIEMEIVGSSYEQNRDRKQTSEERKDLKVENQILQDCSGIAVNAHLNTVETNERSADASCSHRACDANEATLELHADEHATPSNTEVASAVVDNECVVSSSSEENTSRESVFGRERKCFGDRNEPLQQCSEMAVDTQEPFVVTSEPAIEPSCSNHAYEIYKEVEEIASDDYTDCKSEASAVENECVVSSSSNPQRINEIEREDEIESQLIQHCSEIALEEQETRVPITEMDPPCMHRDYNIYADSKKVTLNSNTISGPPNVSQAFAAPGWIRSDPCFRHTFVIYENTEEDTSDNNTKSGSSTLTQSIPEASVDPSRSSRTCRMYEQREDTPSENKKSKKTTSSVISGAEIIPTCSHEIYEGTKEVIDDINSDGDCSSIGESATCCADEGDPSDLSAKSETSNYYKLIPESRVVPSWLHFTSDICEDADEVSLSRNANSKTPAKLIKNEYNGLRSEQNSNHEQVKSETSGEAILTSEKTDGPSKSSTSLATGSSSLFGNRRDASLPGCSNIIAAVKKLSPQKGQRFSPATPRKRDSVKHGAPIVCGKKPSGWRKKFAGGHCKRYLMADANKSDKFIRRPTYTVVDGTADNASPVNDCTPLSMSKSSKELGNSEVASPNSDAGLINESRMDASCCEHADDTKEIPILRTLGINSKLKTETTTGATEEECLGGPSADKTTNHQQIDEMERDDFEEENRLIKYWTERIAAEKGISPSKVLDFSQDNVKASGSKFPDNVFCKSTQASDSNTTIKNMINQTKQEVPKDDDGSNNPSDRWRLRSPILKTKIVYKRLEGRRPYKCSQMPKYNMDDVTARDSPDADVSVCQHDETPSTSKTFSENAAGSKDETSPRSAVIRNFLYEYYSGDADTDDDSFDNVSCTCVTSPDEDSEPENGRKDFDESPRVRRKRPCEAASPAGGTPPKRYLADGPSTSAASAERLPASQGSSAGATSTSHGPPELKQWLQRFNTWSNSERIQAIDALISRSAACQVRHMMNAIEPLFQRDFISLLPKELALSVLGYLEPDDLLRAAQTCRYWRFLADDNLLWRVQCRRIGIKTLKRRTRATPFSDSPWKAAYMRQQMVESNWVKRPVNTPIVMKGHDDHVITCLQFYGKRIVSGSDDTTLKVWSAVTGRCLKTLVGHTGGVWSSQMHGRLVISGSTDRTLRVWNARTGVCLKILAGHTSTVRCMHLYKDRVVSGSRDATLRVWSIPEGRCLRVLVGHLAAVRCVQYDGKVVVSGAYDYFVKIWNPDTGECLHTLAGHTNRVYSLQFDGVHVVSGSLDTSIRVWDVESGSLKHTLIGHQSLTSGMELHANILVSGNADSTVKVWDISTGHCLHTLSGPNKHQSAVTCLQSSKRFVMTSSDDGTVKLWDVRTGEFIRNLVELGSGGSGGVVWRIRASDTKLICAVGSRNGTEETKLLVLNFDLPPTCYKCTQ